MKQAVADGRSYGGGSNARRGRTATTCAWPRGHQAGAFDTDNPSYVRGNVTVRCLRGGDTRLTGIDYRVQDGKLSGVDNNAASAGVHSIDPSTGTATPQSGGARQVHPVRDHADAVSGHIGGYLREVPPICGPAAQNRHRRQPSGPK